MAIFGFDLAKVLDPTTITNTALNVATAGLAPAIKSLVSEVSQMIVQRAGEKLGLNQDAIDKQKDLVARSYGERSASTTTLPQSISRLSGALGLTGTKAADFERQTARSIDKFVNDQARELTRKISDRANGKDDVSATGAGGTLGVLARIAQALGKAADLIVDKMDQLATKLGDAGKIDANNMSKYNQQSSELNALGQLLKIPTSALDQTLEAIGESASTLARRG